MEEWSMLERNFPTEEKARKAAGIIQTTESRLSNGPQGPQFDIETEVIETEAGWRIRWRRVFVGYSSGCGQCKSCKEDNSPPKTGNKPGKLIEFRKR